MLCNKFAVYFNLVTDHNTTAQLIILYTILSRLYTQLLVTSVTDIPNKFKIHNSDRSREYSKGNKTVPEKVATTHKEDGHKQDT